MEKTKASLTNGAGITGCQHVGIANRFISIYYIVSISMHKTQVQADQRLQYKYGYTESFKHSSTGDHFLNIAPVPQTMRATINK